MLQRKQTFWLAIAALISILTYWLPYGASQASQLGTTQVTEIPLNAQNNTILLALSGITALLCLVTIGFFKNRKLQMNICLLIFFLCFGTTIYMYYDTALADPNHKFVIGMLGNQLYIGILIPLIAFVFAALAFVGIRNDEKLVKSMDRLR